MARLVGVIADLREHCRWTAALTHESLMPYLIEESYELADVVEAPGPLDAKELQGELGDVLYQVVLHSLLESESGGFTLGDVAQALRAKLVRRNGHVFRPDGTLQDHFPESIAEIERSYEAAKATEKSSQHSVFDSLPASLPALSLAAKTLDRVEGRTGGRAPDAAHRIDGDQGGQPQTEDELGQLLFEVVRAARTQGLDAERALRTAVRKFQQRPSAGGKSPGQSAKS
ncbi:nucleotide pyrophosphohydrolase [Arthrobacter stackebrandtii]|nr:nucleotide pyrophosphohydrolase [Arthrobacter stackebrandtii]